MSDAGADVTTGDADPVTHALGDEDVTPLELADTLSDGLGDVEALAVTAPDGDALCDTLSVALAHPVQLVL